MNLSLSRRVETAFYGNFSKLHPAQESAVAPVLSGHDAVVLAGTGSGKTEAMAAPIAASSSSAAGASWKTRAW